MQLFTGLTIKDTDNRNSRRISSSCKNPVDIFPFKLSNFQRFQGPVRTLYVINTSNFWIWSVLIILILYTNVTAPYSCGKWHTLHTVYSVHQLFQNYVLWQRATEGRQINGKHCIPAFTILSSLKHLKMKKINALYKCPAPVRTLLIFSPF